MVSLEEFMAVTQGLTNLAMKQKVTYPIDEDAVFARVEVERTSGHLAKQVTRAKVSYEADPNTPGVLIRINADGSRDHGHFKNGVFIKIKNSG